MTSPTPRLDLEANRPSPVANLSRRRRAAAGARTRSSKTCGNANAVVTSRPVGGRRKATTLSGQVSTAPKTTRITRLTGTTRAFGRQPVTAAGLDPGVVVGRRSAAVEQRQWRRPVNRFLWLEPGLPLRRRNMWSTVLFQSGNGLAARRAFVPRNGGHWNTGTGRWWAFLRRP